VRIWNRPATLVGLHCLVCGFAGPPMESRPVPVSVRFSQQDWLLADALGRHPRRSVACGRDELGPPGGNLRRGAETKAADDSRSLTRDAGRVIDVVDRRLGWGPDGSGAGIQSGRRLSGLRVRLGLGWGGRRLLGAGMAGRSSAGCWRQGWSALPSPAKSTPLGKYRRSRPLVFSLVPRCQGLYGSRVLGSWWRCAVARPGSSCAPAVSPSRNGALPTWRGSAGDQAMSMCARRATLPVMRSTSTIPLRCAATTSRKGTGCVSARGLTWPGAHGGSATARSATSDV
jgi:hypothetical protein